MLYFGRIQHAKKRMECPYCKREMIKGSAIVYEYGSILLHKPATMKFTPDDKNKESVKADYLQDWDGYHCETCKKIVAIAPVKKGFFED